MIESSVEIARNLSGIHTLLFVSCLIQAFILIKMLKD